MIVQHKAEWIYCPPRTGKRKVAAFKDPANQLMGTVFGYQDGLVISGYDDGLGFRKKERRFVSRLSFLCLPLIDLSTLHLL